MCRPYGGLRPVPGVPRLSPEDSWDGLPAADEAEDNGGMDILWNGLARSDHRFCASKIYIF